MQVSRLPEIAPTQLGGLRAEPGRRAAVALLHLPVAVFRSQSSFPGAVQGTLPALRQSQGGEDRERPRGRWHHGSTEAHPRGARIPLRSLPGEVLRAPPPGPQCTLFCRAPRPQRSLKRQALDNPRGGRKNRPRSKNARPRDYRSSPGSCVPRSEPQAAALRLRRSS